MERKRNLRARQQQDASMMETKQRLLQRQTIDSTIPIDDNAEETVGSIKEYHYHHQQQHFEENSLVAPQDSSSSSSIDPRSLQMLSQDQEGNNQFLCQSLDVVDACRGTSVGYKYRGTFFPYEGPCESNKILQDYPIYKTTTSPPKYMYAIGIYPDSWSVQELRGLVRWRIVDFETFQDEDTCRVESANINQIDFAANGQPYNYWPTIYCFDNNGNDLDGFKSSTINIRCNDRLPSFENNNNSNNNNKSNNNNNNNIFPGAWQQSNGGQENSNTAVVLGILLGLAASAFIAYALYTKCWNRKTSKGRTTKGTATTTGSNDDDDDDDDSDKHPTKMTIFAPKATNTQFDDELVPRRPYSTGSILVDELSQADRKPASMQSMQTVSKPYELVERRMEKRAPEPPPTSPLSQSRGFVPRKFAVNNNHKADDKPWGNPFGTTQMGNNNTTNNHKKQAEPKPVKHHQYEPLQRPREESTKWQDPSNSDSDSDSEQDSSSSETDFNEENTFMSESLSNMFKDIDKTLDNAMDDESTEPPKRNPITNQHRDPPPQEKSAPGKHDDMDLSQRSKFMEARGKWSDRGRGFGKEEYQQRSRSHEDSRASKHAATSSKSSGGGGKVAELLSKFNNNNNGSNGNFRQQQQPRRSKSLDNSRANEFANSRRTTPPSPKRSRSKERSGAETWAQQTNGTRSRSKERSQANAHAEKGRSRSRERSGANDYLSQQQKGNAQTPQRSRSRERSGADAFANKRSASQERSAANNFAAQTNVQTPQKGRSRSRERSGANAFANKRSASQERSAANAFAAQKDGQKGRSRSRERSGADAFANRRSASQERSAANNFAGQKETRRGRSKERSGANDYASSGKIRPKSLEQTGARGFAQTSGKGRPSRSLERSTANKHASNNNNNNRKQQQGARNGVVAPKGRSRSFDSSNAKTFAAKNRGKASGAPKTRSRSFDSSKANQYAGKKKSTPVPPKPSTIITKNKDGSVVVERKRRREDGATVTTKTKYANIALARKHGVAV